MNKKLNILICPLEWGLGHAGRMIPVAEKFLESGHTVLIGAGRELTAFFRNELPGVTIIPFSGFKPVYSRIFPQYLALIVRIPVLIYHIISEHFRLKKIIGDHKIDIVISDNRFGLWNRDVRTVYITHQIVIPFPKKLRSFEWIGRWLHRYIIRKYSWCLIPDLPGENNLSGRLSHGIKLPKNCRFIGLLSRLDNRREPETDHNYPVPRNVVILSGPEPQRSILKQKLVALLADRDIPTFMLEAKPGDKREISKTGNITVYNHLSSDEMKGLISGCENIISRSGYTTIMELASLGRGALLIPTPGQTEQEYLADYLSSGEWFDSVKQKCLEQGLSLPGKMIIDSNDLNSESRALLDKVFEEILK